MTAELLVFSPRIRAWDPAALRGAMPRLAAAVLLELRYGRRRPGKRQIRRALRELDAWRGPAGCWQLPQALRVRRLPAEFVRVRMRFVDRLDWPPRGRRR